MFRCILALYQQNPIESFLQVNIWLIVKFHTSPHHIRFVYYLLQQLFTQLFNY